MPKFITPEGRTIIENELEILKGKKPEIAQRIRSAREQGDLSENSEHSSAKEDLSLVESRIKEIENLLRSAQTVEDREKSDCVVFGATVTIKVNQKIQIYTLVGSEEADPSQGSVSYKSPIGQALLGKKVGEKVTIKTPKADIQAEIIKIE
ncbi:transcription elongation factor GreA [Patescibacteria group bacterium]|nr:transcription elongation factor GreA [Patescibacteria group bacterium]